MQIHARGEEYPPGLKPDFVLVCCVGAEAPNSQAATTLGEVILEIALIVCSLTLLTKKRIFWFSGIALGLVGLMVTFSGHLLRSAAPAYFAPADLRFGHCATREEKATGLRVRPAQ